MSRWSLPVVFYDRFADNEPKTEALEDEELVEHLTAFDPPRCSAATCTGRDCVAKKATRCWSPVTYVEGTRRADRNVQSVNYAVFDLDHLAPGQLDDVRASIAEYEHVIHSTHSHAAGDECYRLIFPLTRPVMPDEWPAVRATIVTVLNLPADPKCGNLSRLYACPDVREGVEPVALHHRGEAIDVEHVLEAAAHLAGTPPKEVTPPIPDVNGPVDLAALRDRLARARRSKAHGSDHAKEQAAILGRLLDGEALAGPGERDATLLRACGLMTYWLPFGTPWEAALEVLRPALMAMDTQPEGLAHWIEEGRDMYARQQVSRAAAEARRAADDVRLQEMVREVRGATVERVGEVLGDSWPEMVIQAKGGPKVCEHNIDLILSHDEDMKGNIRFNEFTKQIEVTDGPLKGVPQASLDGRAAAWLQRTHNLMAGEHAVGKALLRVARDNPYDPIAEYLNELAWDRTPRLDTFLERYFGVGVTEHNHIYVRAVSRRWVISLVARALKPGCKVDTVLVFEGVQGAGKSTALEALVGYKYFLDTALTLGDKECMQALASAWLIELAELASFRRAETNKVKQFISSRVDKFRPPYGRVVEDYPRRSVFVGSTNEDEYLNDPTGNRRYWPVRVGKKVDVEGIVRDRDQIFAEAVEAFGAGEIWWLSDEEMAQAAHETEERVESSALEEAVERWWAVTEPAKRPRQFTLLDVAEAIGISVERLTHQQRIEIGTALRRSGFKRRQHREGERKGRHYEPSQELLDIPRRPRPVTAPFMGVIGKDKGDK